MAYTTLSACAPECAPRRMAGWARGLGGARGLCAVLALALALVQASSLALASRSAAGTLPKERLAAYVPWIEKAMQPSLRGAGALARDYARYYAWSKGYPGDVRVVLMRDPGHAGAHVVEVDDIPGSAEGTCDVAARVDVVRRRVVEVGCNPGL